MILIKTKEKKPMNGIEYTNTNKNEMKSNDKTQQKER